MSILSGMATAAPRGAGGWAPTWTGLFAYRVTVLKLALMKIGSMQSYFLKIGSSPIFTHA